MAAGRAFVCRSAVVLVLRGRWRGAGPPSSFSNTASALRYSCDHGEERCLRTRVRPVRPEPAHQWTITGPEGTVRAIDLCDRHGAPVANAFALAQPVTNRRTRPGYDVESISGRSYRLASSARRRTLLLDDRMHTLRVPRGSCARAGTALKRTYRSGVVEQGRKDEDHDPGPRRVHRQVAGLPPLERDERRAPADEPQQ
jgi:hypothetical protein